MNLFKFMMDLLDEDEKEIKEEALSEPVKRLKNPNLPHHPLLNPYVTELTPNLQSMQSPFSDPNSLFSKMAEIDKRNADELGKLRAVKQATSPLIKELQELKKQGHDNATEAKEEEELEFLKGDIEQRMGVTIENGKTKLVEIPTALRDKIPLDNGDKSVIGYSVDNSEELKGINDLPKEVREKIESDSEGDSYLKDSKMPQVIKDALMNAPTAESIAPTPIERTTSEEPQNEEENNTSENKE